MTPPSPRAGQGESHCAAAACSAVATGVALMLVLSATASACHLALGGHLPWRLVVAAAPGVLIGGWVGGHLHRRFSEARFKELFVLLLVFLAAHVTFNAL